jgi:sulfate permease, SulP family
MILFPTGAAPFADTGPDGISMFYVSCIVSQVIYSSGSIFRGGVGSEMVSQFSFCTDTSPHCLPEEQIEVVPFFHKMAYMILDHVGEENAAAVRATTITSYAISSIITGIVFFALGAFKIGNLVSFFPRSILTGCIGGVGIFLILTGVEVGSRLEGSFEFDGKTFSHIGDPHALLLWIIPLILAVVLLVIRHYYQHPAILPAFFIAVGAIFYIVIAATRLDLDVVRDSGWIFKKVESGVPFYNFYTYYGKKLHPLASETLQLTASDFNIVNWEAIGKTVPTMFALSFFGVIHVPINIPALGVAVKEDDVNINRELIAHGASNTLSGLVGSIQVCQPAFRSCERDIANHHSRTILSMSIVFSSSKMEVTAVPLASFLPRLPWPSGSLDQP